MEENKDRGTEGETPSQPWQLMHLWERKNRKEKRKEKETVCR